MTASSSGSPVRTRRVCRLGWPSHQSHTDERHAVVVQIGDDNRTHFAGLRRSTVAEALNQEIVRTEMQATVFAIHGNQFELGCRSYEMRC